jgi:hypothetical protein
MKHRPLTEHEETALIEIEEKLDALPWKQLKNPLALPTSAHKVKPSRNRFGGLLVMPALKRLQQTTTTTKGKQRCKQSKPNTFQRQTQAAQRLKPSAGAGKSAFPILTNWAGMKYTAKPSAHCWRNSCAKMKRRERRLVKTGGTAHS